MPGETSPPVDMAVIKAQLDRIERNLTALLTAYSTGGLRGLRAAAAVLHREANGQ